MCKEIPCHGAITKLPLCIFVDSVISGLPTQISFMTTLLFTMSKPSLRRAYLIHVQKEVSSDVVYMPTGTNQTSNWFVKTLIWMLRSRIIVFLDKAVLYFNLIPHLAWLISLSEFFDHTKQFIPRGKTNLPNTLLIIVLAWEVGKSMPWWKNTTKTTCNLR